MKADLHLGAFSLGQKTDIRTWGRIIVPLMTLKQRTAALLTTLGWLYYTFWLLSATKTGVCWLLNDSLQERAEQNCFLLLAGISQWNFGLFHYRLHEGFFPSPNPHFKRCSICLHQQIPESLTSLTSTSSTSTVPTEVSIRCKEVPIEITAVVYSIKCSLAFPSRHL